MAKGQKRSGREAKKPKATKKPAASGDNFLPPPARPAPAKGSKQ